MKREWKKLAAMVAVFVVCYFLPVGAGRFDSAVRESLSLLREYARQHVLLCLVPAFFIAGAMAVFISQASVVKYLGAKANKALAYGVASVSGSILAVCSCTVLPLFAGIHRMGAGLGPAVTFLYAGPAVNVLAIVLTARVLGWQLGLARALGAVVFSVVIGVLMQLIFRRSEARRAESAPALPEAQVPRPLWKNATFFGAMVAVLVLANWARSGDVRAVFLCCPGGLQTYRVEGQLVSEDGGVVTIVDTAGREVRIPAGQLKELREVEKSPAYEFIYRWRWAFVAVVLTAFGAMVASWFRRAELGEWVGATWGFAKQILPLLFIGVLVAGLLLGRPGREGLVPSAWVEKAVGGNSLRANVFASVAGALMYFATLTEVPILHGLLGSGMGKGPALALLLAGPALSLPNMLVIRSVLGTTRTLVYVLLVVVMATLSGLIFGALCG